MNWVDICTEGVYYKDLSILSDDDKKNMLKSICRDTIMCKDFDWKCYPTLVKLLPYVDCLTNKQREKFMKIISGKVLVKLDYKNDYIYYYDLTSDDIPFLFELKNVLIKLWDTGYEAQYMIKNIDIAIKDLLNSIDREKFEYIDMFFSKLDYPYTRQSLKKCKLKILKENHPDNGGSGEYIDIVQSIYKNFLSYIDRG